MSSTKLSTNYRLSGDIAFTVDNEGATVIYPIGNTRHYSRLSKAARLFLSCFPTGSAISLEDAFSTYFALCGIWKIKSDRTVVTKLAKRLIDAHILIREADDLYIYSDEMIELYPESRAVPCEVCNTILKAAAINNNTRVLDIATGPGSIAIQLATVSNNVTGLDISSTFLDVARKQAREKHLNAKFRLGNANKLLFESGHYDVITMAQAFHWLDPVLVTRGICHLLPENGEYFAIETSSIVPADHPLRHYCQYGVDNFEQVDKFCMTQADNYAQWFKLLAGPTYYPQLTDRWIVEEFRSFDYKFARAYFFTSQLRSILGNEKTAWLRFRQIIDSYQAANHPGTMFWHIMRFKNRNRSMRTEHIAHIPDAILIS